MLKSAKEIRSTLVEKYSTHKVLIEEEHPRLIGKINSASREGKRGIFYCDKELTPLDIGTLEWLDYTVEKAQYHGYNISW